MLDASNALSWVVVEADMLVAFKKQLDWHTDIQRMKGYGSCPGRWDPFNLASRSAQASWAKGPVPKLDRPSVPCMFFSWTLFVYITGIN